MKYTALTEGQLTKIQQLEEQTGLTLLAVIPKEKGAWKMSKEEYFKLKEEGWKDALIARNKGVNVRTLDRWKAKEEIISRLNRKNKNRGL